MRFRPPLAGAAAIAATAGLTAPSAPPAATTSCADDGTKTIRATREVRIFQRRDGDGWMVYGCAYAVGRRHELGFRDSYEYATDILSIAGSHVAYLSGFVGETQGHFRLMVQDLRSGKIRHSVEEEHPSTVVLHRAGAVAWTTTTCLWDGDERLPGARRFEDDCRYVIKADASGARVVEADLGIALRSIRLDGRTVRWKTRGRARSYRLRLH